MTDPGVLLLLGVAGGLFALGLLGLMSRTNLIKMVLSLELLGKGVSLVFIVGGVLAGDVGTSQAIVFTLIVIEAVVAALALALVVLTKRVWRTLDAVQVRAEAKEESP